MTYKKGQIKFIIASMVSTLVAAVAMPLVAVAAPAPAFGLEPFTFVGAAGDCGTGYPAGSNIVVARWDNTTGNPSPSILLQKNGPTADCSAAGVDILTPLEGGPVSALTELNFDYKNGGHCGAGAPRFNIQTNQGTAFLGCAGGTQTDAGNGYTHFEFTGPQLAVAYLTAGIDPLTATLQDVYIIFDEGTDTLGGTPGSINIDNISVNNAVVGSPTSPQSKDECKKDGYKSFFPAFKNQGDCVSFVATKGKNGPAGAKPHHN